MVLLDQIISYSLISMVSLTAVGAFDLIDSILVVALMGTPPATAYMPTERQGQMLALSSVIGVTAAASCYSLAHSLEVSIGGEMARPPEASSEWPWSWCGSVVWFPRHARERGNAWSSRRGC